ncbi:S8 family peptidase [Edaphobacillus lindanitolerans]|uniref:Bacillopeptidase F. Serine peptidase. MEROPS family S08A n=1 Tax=Edaphobacillus lindanitolerans TaxID=550447 RepID=A0A1U7PIL2_9BACI|nr:S8 family peptidase [Edaphobacillus lindanitolerans]SIT66124.1 bacillopeptidase F. Serine peptidase. MEROPS family S08A [Edaphobacillus lindanitolerans]
MPVTKKKQKTSRLLSMAASVLMVSSLIVPGIVSAESRTSVSAVDTGKVIGEKLSDRLISEFKKDDKVTFLVKFKEQADTETAAAEARKTAKDEKLSAHKAKLAQRSAVVSELKATAQESQADVKKYLKLMEKSGDAENIRSYHIVNGMAVTATKDVAEKIASFQEVEKILPDETRELNVTKTPEAKTPKSKTANVEWNVERVRAPETWALGIDGAGTVVASIDTGVQWDHPALKEKYRGYNAATGEANHDFNWFDATAGRGTPYDDQGHGTHVTGTMVGSEPGGNNQVGVAPGAKWIAVKAFTAAGGSDSDLLAAAQWILAPRDAQGNERVDMAPDVVNNSWGGGPGLDEWYRDVVRNWRAAEIFPEFSAGNTTLGNPGGPGSVASPSNYPESFATGATDINNKVAGFSLRGPSPYSEIKPDISAPGVNIRSSVPGSGYEGGWNGTSMAGPAVSAVAAMLRQVNADITVDEMEQILMDTAKPLTDSEYPTSPNHGYGYGLVDSFSAVSSLISGIGGIEGRVMKEGDDSEAPAFEHEAPAETYAGMDLELSIRATDNVSISNVTLNYTDAEGNEQTKEAVRVSGSFTDGTYAVTVPGEHIAGDSFDYSFTVNDFGNNTVTAGPYSVSVQPGITTGYFTDFAQKPNGWESFGEADSWEWGVPTSGPGSAASGDNVYATNLSGPYANYMNATLVMPPVDLPDGQSFLQFKHWHNFEESSAGHAWDYGHVFISTDYENWTQLRKIQGSSGGWIDTEVDLSDYAGQRVYIGFNAYSDVSVTRDGWYIDSVGLSDASNAPDASKDKPGKGKDKGNEEKSDDKPGNQLANILGKGLQPEAIKDKGPGLTLKKPVDPTKIKPVMPKKEIKPIEDGKTPAPVLLPLGAKVNVLETGSSVYTNPANGTYSMRTPAGDYTLMAEAYGYRSAEQNVSVAPDETSNANFLLEEVPMNTVSGSITDASDGEPVAGATVYLVEDANVAPVETGADGGYSISAYEGSYTVKVVANGYHGQEARVTIGEDGAVQNFELEPFYTVPGDEIGYDDGTAENARAFYDAGNGWSVKMTLPEGKEQGIVSAGVFRFWDTEWPVPGGTEFAVEVWDAKGADGAPGKKIAGPFDATALRNGEWTVVDLSEHAITVGKDFYMVYIQTKANPNTPGLATDENGPNAKRSYQFVGGAWSPAPADEGNYMIRARVDFEVVAPVITSPAESSLTNEPALTVEGTASPTTDIRLDNNGEEVGTATVGDDGKFKFDVTLQEGENTFTATSLLGGKTTGTSEPVTVTLDSAAPELSIDSPADGDKTNRETVTVQGTVSDDHLDSVTVNGQAADVKDGKYSKRVLLDNGRNKIDVVATDGAGNRSAASVTITAKYDAPKISNLTPAEDVHVKTGQTVKFEFDSDPGLKASFFMHMPLTNHVSQATELPMMETAPGHYVGYWTAPSSLTADGARLEVKIQDDFENVTRQVAPGKIFVNMD